MPYSLSGVLTIQDAFNIYMVLHELGAEQLMSTITTIQGQVLTNLYI